MSLTIFQQSVKPPCRNDVNDSSSRSSAARGSVLDPFGWTRERDRYFALVDEIVVHLDGTNFEVVVALASYPDEIQGYGVKEESVKRAEAHIEALRAQFSEDSPDGPTGGAPLPLVLIACNHDHSPSLADKAFSGDGFRLGATRCQASKTGSSTTSPISMPANRSRAGSIRV